MSEIPSDPRAFFEVYLPERAASLSERLRQITSVGSLVFRVPDVGIWSVRLVEGDLEVTRHLEDDVLLQVTVAAADFEPLVVAALRRAGPDAGLSRPGALRALALDPRTARGLRHMPGSVLFVMADGAIERRVHLVPGAGNPDPERADCTIACTMDDYMAIQSGAAQPLQLFASGRLRLTGNVQLALALSGIFA